MYIETKTDFNSSHNTITELLTYLCNECPKLVQVAFSLRIKTQFSDAFIELLSSFIRILE